MTAILLFTKCAVAFSIGVVIFQQPRLQFICRLSLHSEGTNELV